VAKDDGRRRMSADMGDNDIDVEVMLGADGWDDNW
jgi:hypothetical protein